MNEHPSSDFAAMVGPNVVTQADIKAADEANRIWADACGGP
jgi:hypothetical protein